MPRNRGSVSNRTHRVIRERARTMQAQRTRNRALLAPLLVASSLVVILVLSAWLMFDEYEIGNVNPSEARFHLPILLIWFLPVTCAVLILALVRRLRSRSSHQETR